MEQSTTAPKQDNAKKCWLYTCFYDLDKTIIPDELCEYRIEGKELCPKTQKPHIQGYVIFKKKIRFTALKKLHTNAQWTAANGSGWQNFVYCSKDGDFLELGDRPKQPKKKEKDTTYDEALAATTVQEALTIVKTKRARDYCLHGEAIERNLKRQKTPKYEAKYAKGTFVHAPELIETKAVLLAGKSNTGKTQFALSCFNNPLLIRHIDTLKTISPDHDGLVFDDMSFRHWPIEAVIHLLDTDCQSTINVRYGTVTIPANTRKIFTHNTTNPFYDENTAPEEQQQAIERRLQRYNINKQLY